MDMDKVRSLARGRVWSGQDAFQHGLVDGLGGLSDAVSTAKELANLPQVSHLQAFSQALDFFAWQNLRQFMTTGLRNFRLPPRGQFVCASEHYHMSTSSVR